MIYGPAGPSDATSGRREKSDATGQKDLASARDPKIMPNEA
jgi:hypothetical protein